jgi:AAA family ATP:ADP antiporter
MAQPGYHAPTVFEIFRSVRVGERRDTWVAFATLFGLIGSHALLETARDALFLSKIPATQLPWVYLGIAAVSLLVARLGRGGGGRTALSLTIFAAGGVTGGLWLTLSLLGDAGLYVLYIWSGVLTTLILVRFWTYIGGLFHVTQAKRLYGVIGAGSVLGAITGSAIARELAQRAAPETLIGFAAGGFVLSGFVVFGLSAPEQDAAPLSKSKGEAQKDGVVDDAKWMSRSPYARHIVILALVSAACLTITDFVFKAAVADLVEPAQLGEFFATVYLILNVLSLVAQLGLVRYVLARSDVSVALAILPAFLFLGGVGMVVAASIGVAIAMKGADGALRYSLHRTALELLFVPLSARKRGRVKEIADVLGQKGGQALASVVILGLVYLGANVEVLSVVLAALAVTWIVVALGIRIPYLALFRNRLQKRQVENLGNFPELDVASLETLLATLDSEDDDEVVAALTVLEREQRTRVVPGLILYHPSSAVVVRALQLFMRAGRTNIVPIAGRLLNHRLPKARAAAIAARSVLAPDEELLRSYMRSEDDSEARAAAAVQLAASRTTADDEEARRILDRILSAGSVDAKLALATGIEIRRAEGFEDELTALARDRSIPVRQGAIDAMRAVFSPAYYPVLLKSLAHEGTRPLARAALSALGDDALPHLEAAFSDEDLEERIRWQLPKTLARFRPEAAGPILLKQLPVEESGLVRYRIIRALEALRRVDPELALDQAALRKAAEETLESAYRFLDLSVSLEDGALQDSDRETPGHTILHRLLLDKKNHAVGRLFRLLGLLHPQENFMRIYRSATSDDRTQRATGLELIENVLRPPMRGAVLGLVDDLPPRRMLSHGAHYYAAERRGYEALLEVLLSSPEGSMRELTFFHIGELELIRMRPVIVGLPEAVKSSGDALRALELIDAAQSAETLREGAHDAE